MSEEKLDKLLDACQDISVRMASVERTIEEWRINIQRFYDVTMPALQKQVDKNEERIQSMEQKVDGLAGKVSMISAGAGGAAAAAIAWFKHLFGG